MSRNLVNFNNKWLDLPEFKDWLTKVDDQTGRCSLCGDSFKIGYLGRGAVTRHKNSGNHKKNESAKKTSQAIKTFVKSASDLNKEKLVTIAEVCSIYHGIMHHNSYLSIDCGNKLYRQIFSDSDICKKIHCGRTKSSKIAENILAPYSIKKHLIQLKEDKKFSIAIDASNKGNIKLYPIALKYFSVKSGIVNFLLDFYECSNESSRAIYDNIKSSLNENNLSVNNIIAYTADNTSVNYGCHNSVYVNLQNEHSFIQKANCNCHIVHNTAKHALIKLPIDIENLVMKIYAHFATSAKRLDSLKSCYELSDNYSKLFRHVPTRWLSLFPAISRIIDNMDAIISYFIGINSEECHQIIIDFVWSSQRDNNLITLSELYLYFTHHFMTIFNETILKLESDLSNSTHLFSIMNDLRVKLINRKELRFYGTKVNNHINKFSEVDKKQFLKVAYETYDKAINYLQMWFDFTENSIYLKLQNLDLERKLEHNILIYISKTLNLLIDEDKLFDECNTINDLIPLINNQYKELSHDKKWCKLLESYDAPNMLKIVESVLIIPIGNQYVERTFSIMNNIWKDERNRLSVNLVKAELCVKLNYSMSCQEFYYYVKDNQELLNLVKSQKKYEFS